MVTQPVDTPPSLARTIVWASILVTIGITQALRAVFVDASFFFAAAILLTFDALLASRSLRRSRPRFPVRATAAVLLLSLCLICAIPLVLAPRHGLLLAAALGLVGATVLALAWKPRTPIGPTCTNRAMVRSTVLWVGLIAAIGLWELASFVWGFHGEVAVHNHPTVSDLLDSVLDILPGRIVFAATWLALGVIVVRPQLGNINPIRNSLAPGAGMTLSVDGGDG